MSGPSSGGSLGGGSSGGGPSSGGTLGNGSTPQSPLTVASPGNKQLGDGPITLSAVGGSSSGAITFTCSQIGVLEISGNIAKIMGAGTGVAIIATRAGNSTYADVSGTSATFNVTAPSNPTSSQVLQFVKNKPTQSELNTLVANHVTSASSLAAAYDVLNQEAVANAADMADPEVSVSYYNAMKAALDPAGNAPITIPNGSSSYINTTNFLRVADSGLIAAAGVTSTILSYPNFTDGEVTIDLPDVMDSTIAYLNKCPIGYSITYRHGGVSHTVINRADGLYLVQSGAETLYVLGTPLAFDGTFTYTIWAQGSNEGSGNNGSGPVPCFTRGTMIRVPGGEAAVETLKRGDLVVTADGRTVAIKGLYKTHVAVTTAETAPYLIPAGLYSNRDLLLSPKHAIQIRKGVWNFPGFATRTNAAIRQVAVGEAVDYYHLECPVFLRDNLVANGCVVESFGTLQVNRNPYTYSARLGGFTREGPKATKSASL